MRCLDASSGATHNWVGDSDAFCGRLGAVLDGCDPAVLLSEKLVAGKETAGVAVWAHAEEDEVEDGIPDALLACKCLDKLLLVGVREFLGVVEERLVNGVDLGSLELGNLGEELLVAEVVVAVLVVQGDEALIGKEDLPGGR